MNRQRLTFVLAVAVSLVPAVLTGCKIAGAPLMKQAEPVTTQRFFPNRTAPLVNAGIKDITIGPFDKNVSKSDLSWFGLGDLASKELSKGFRDLLSAPGFSIASREHSIIAKAIPISFEQVCTNPFSCHIELSIRYEFSAADGNMIFNETIDTKGLSRGISGYEKVKTSIEDAVSKSLVRLSSALENRLPASWQAHLDKKDAMDRQISSNLNKENKYFRVITSNATIRKRPDAEAPEVLKMPQASLIHVTGTLPNGWLQVSREGMPIGWVHSSLLREDFAAAPTYKPDRKYHAMPAASAPDTTRQLEDFTSLDFGKYYALVVGNNLYRHLPRLKTAVNDARAIAAILQNDYGFDVRLLENATRADIFNSLTRYRTQLDFRDNLLVFYAGHGWLDKDADEGYWLPVDAQENNPTHWISNSSITASLRAMKAKHVLVVADSCYSGKLARGINLKIRTNDYIRRMSAKKARTVMASGGLEPVADEGMGGKHSVFCSELMKALQENNGVMDATLLFSKIRRPVILNADQTPEYSDIRKAGHDGGDFLFVKKNN